MSYLKVTLKKSGIGFSQDQKDTIRGLGLRRLQQNRILKDTPAIRGLINKVKHLVAFEEVKSSTLSKVEKVSTYQLK